MQSECWHAALLFEKKASGMTIVAAARYEVTCLESKKSAEVTKNIPFDWNEKITDFLKQSEIWY